jgi:hypothetical protein
VGIFLFYVRNEIEGMNKTVRLEIEARARKAIGTLFKCSAIPIIYSSTNRELATERAAGWLSKHFTYWWLEKNGYGRVLIDSDGL